MAPGDAALEIVGDIEEGAIAVGNLGIHRQQLGVDGIRLDGGVNTAQNPDRRFHPDAPMAEQPALDSDPDFPAVPFHDERRQQVEDDVIVVARVQSDPVRGASLDHAANEGERLVPVERRHLDRDHVFDGGEAAPEGGGQDAAADGRLQIKTDQRNFLRHAGAMLDDLVLARALECRQADESGVIAEGSRDLRFADRLAGLAHQPGDAHEWPVGPSLYGLDRQPEYGFVQAGLADFELGCVHPDCQAARARIDVVAAERPLPSLVQCFLRRQGQRMRGNHHTLAQCGDHGLRQIGPVKPHRQLPWFRSVVPATG